MGFEMSFAGVLRRGRGSELVREIVLEVTREINSLLPALRLRIDFKKHLRPSAFWFH